MDARDEWNGIALRTNAARAGRMALALAALAIAPACTKSRGGDGPCARIVGTWQGVRAVADPGRDPNAVAVMDEVVRNERWRITRVTPAGFQRERRAHRGGRPVGDAMYVHQERAGLCVMRLADQRTVRFELQRDGTLSVRAADGWFASVFRRE